MDTRRDFIRKAALLSGAAGVMGTLPGSIQRALAIDPAPGSTFYDAEHIVILMQENRSFDHAYGSLKGVRGFNDPRAIRLPDNNLVWLQTDSNGNTYAPFRLNIKDTKATWMSSLPHSWANQVDARNNGRYNKWLQVKQSGNKDWAAMPLTLGFYNREDIPFYYSLADAFTVCDQNFCSSLTGTTPNRLYLWTGSLRDEQKAEAKANVWNEDVDYGAEAHWTTFPERLEDNGISWKIYQNEISAAGLEGEKDGLLANFTDNPIEWFSAFNVRFAIGHIKYLQHRIQQVTADILQLEGKLASGVKEDEATKLKQAIEKKEKELTKYKKDATTFTTANLAKLSTRAQNLHHKAFTTNIGDPDYHELETLQYKDGDTARSMQVPKGDILFQFREDVKKGQLPTVSWLVAPGEFSDHPGSPWYGAWYVSEVLDILTQKEEIWKKTVFILCYDENDGYFDHVPPFVAPHKPGTGLVSKGIDTSLEYVTHEQEEAKKHVGKHEVRESPIGLGYRVPLVVASPWTRGGYVNSQVFDHTSILQFMEKFLQRKTGKIIKETNITAWRRTVCGDLTSVFRPFNGEKVRVPFPQRNEFIEGVYNAKFKKLPDEFKKLTAEEITHINENPGTAEWMPRQEPGIRPSCSLPYQLYVNGKLSADRKTFEISFAASNETFGKQAAGSPFNVYAPGKYIQADSGQMEPVRAWSYAVTSGDKLNDNWPLHAFENDLYHLRVYGPNGFYREFAGNVNDPQAEVICNYQRSAGNIKKLSGNVELKLINRGGSPLTFHIKDMGYKKGELKKTLAARTEGNLIIDLSKSFGWYDFTVQIDGAATFEQRYAGRVETGKDGFSDPVMGGTV
ncbi:MAG TPA: phospholipase C, phosphocholine-specific [Chitinophaga sp.]|uniref:phosphocholine-specific phospholipase C n=1 Tax=Chitinophaga sp. TaxID=1869181 RepID=UPI002BEA7162|nr:phospholipase C, phosphocholine-specific [Chitinophaga sp.]HVI47664.1 phospholipase C, phosphocholine-specific [Chitinophaga sp.]